MVEQCVRKIGWKCSQKSQLNEITDDSLSDAEWKVSMVSNKKLKPCISKLQANINGIKLRLIRA